MSIKNRPFTGTWTEQVRNKKVKRHVPDIIVNFNGEPSVPSCAGCSGRIDMQDFITSVTVSNSTDTSPANASISLSIPTNRYACLFRDNKFVLQTGMEVHIYMRGYFSTTQLTAYQGDFDRDGEIDLDQIPMKPYYQVFHGVVTESSFSFGGGFYDASLTCNDLLHFWQYQNINTNPSYLGSRVDGNKTTLNYTGNKYTRKNAYHIIFELFLSRHGDAGAQDFYLSDFTNTGIKSDTFQDSFWDVAGWYWQQRFEQPMSKLKMHGADGRQFTTLEALAIADQALSETFGGKESKDWMNIGVGAVSTQALLTKVLTLLRQSDPDYAFPISSLFYVDQAAFIKVDSGTYQGMKGNNVAAQTAFALDLGSVGQVNTFEAQMTTKMDLASTVCAESGFEFYIDMNGDYVFKPPFYNLDTSSSRVYTIKDIDIISFDNSESEPSCTVMKGTGGYFGNMSSLLSSEFENRGMYVDWKLVAKYGWRESDFQTTFLNDPKSIYYACINRMYLENKELQSGSVSIPLRPEMRMGYPVYIEPFDCFYYVNSISHSFSFGGECTTDLGLIAKRAKFFPPMAFTEGMPSIEDVDLENIYRTSRPLYTRNREGLPMFMGVPNVVMALDPSVLNPLWIASGDITQDFFNEALNLKGVSVGDNNYEQVLTLVTTMVTDGYCTLTKTTDSTTEDHIVFLSGGQETPPLSLQDLGNYFKALHDRIKSASNSPEGTWKRGALNEFTSLYSEEELNSNPTFALFMKSLDRFRADRTASAFGADRSPADNYLASLQFMKSSFRPDDQHPGSYRYYSDAMPNFLSNHGILQGMLDVSQKEVTIEVNGVTQTAFADVLRNPISLPAPVQTTKICSIGDGTYKIVDPNDPDSSNFPQGTFETKYGFRIIVPSSVSNSNLKLGGYKEHTYNIVPSSKITRITFGVPKLKTSSRSAVKIPIRGVDWDYASPDLEKYFWKPLYASIYFVGERKHASNVPDTISRINGGTEDASFGDFFRDFLEEFKNRFPDQSSTIPSHLDLWDQATSEVFSVSGDHYYIDGNGDREIIQPNTPIVNLFVPQRAFDGNFTRDATLLECEKAVREKASTLFYSFRSIYESLHLEVYRAYLSEIPEGISVESMKGFLDSLQQNLERFQKDWRALIRATLYSHFSLPRDYSKRVDSTYELRPLQAGDDLLNKSIYGGYTNGQTPKVMIGARSTVEGEPYFSPILPVSDNKGFEHFGVYAYGRDYTLASFQSVTSSPPDLWANLSPPEMNNFLETLQKIDKQKGGITANTLSQVYLSGTLTDATRAKLNSILADSLVSEYSSLPEGYSENLLRDETLVHIQQDRGYAAQQFQRQFSNDIVEKSKQYGAGISAENIPISLAQLDQEYSPFQCSGSAGSTALDKSYGFLVVDSSTDLTILDGGLDIASYVQDLSSSSLVDWATRQEAIRGNFFPATQSSASLGDYEEAIDLFAQIPSRIEDAFGQIGETIDDNFNDDED